MSEFRIINELVGQINKGQKQELINKNKEYLDSFTENNREEEYQKHTSSCNEIDLVMESLKTVSGVTNHLNTLQVKLGKEILNLRLELGLMQSTLVEICKSKGIRATQPMISKMELGERNIEEDTYVEVMNVLKMTRFGL